MRPKFMAGLQASCSSCASSSGRIATGQRASTSGRFATGAVPGLQRGSISPGAGARQQRRQQRAAAATAGGLAPPEAPPSQPVLPRGGRGPASDSSAPLSVMDKVQFPDIQLQLYDPSSPASFDVVVVGSGPSGLAVADRVAAAGFKVRPQAWEARVTCVLRYSGTAGWLSRLGVHKGSRKQLPRGHSTSHTPLHRNRQQLHRRPPPTAPLAARY